MKEYAKGYFGKYIGNPVYRFESVNQMKESGDSIQEGSIVFVGVDDVTFHNLMNN